MKNYFRNCIEIYLHSNMKNKVSNTGKILSLIAFSIYAIMVGLTTFEISLEKESAFNLIAMHDADNNSGNDNPTDNNQLTNIDIEDTTDYWISKIQGSGELRLQYAQNINIIFPTQLDLSLPIIWPHIGLNTLKKVE